MAEGIERANERAAFKEFPKSTHQIMAKLKQTSSEKSSKHEIAPKVKSDKFFHVESDIDDKNNEFMARSLSRLANNHSESKILHVGSLETNLNDRRDLSLDAGLFSFNLTRTTLLKYDKK